MKNLINSPALRKLLLTLATILLAAFGVQGVDPSSESSVIAGVVAGSVSLLHLGVQWLRDRAKANEQLAILDTLQRLEAALIQRKEQVEHEALDVVERVRLLVRTRSNPPPPDGGAVVEQE